MRKQRPENRGAAVCVDCESNKEKVSQRLPHLTCPSVHKPVGLRLRLSSGRQSSSMENWGTNTSVPPVIMPPLAITFTTSTCRSARSRTAATISFPPFTSPPRKPQWPPGVVIGGPEATIQGNPSSTCRCASRRLTHVEMPVAEVTNRRHTSGQLPSQRLGDYGLDLLRRVAGDALQRQNTAVADEVDMGVDQPGSTVALP
jgi:hypothetical protein